MSATTKNKDTFFFMNTTAHLDALCSVNFEDALHGCPEAAARIAALNPLLRAYAAARVAQEYAAYVGAPCGFLSAARVAFGDALAMGAAREGSGGVV